MERRTNSLILILLTSFSLALVYPTLIHAVSAPSQLVPCDTTCGWNDLLTLVQRVINFLLYIAGSLAAISFAWAGFLYLTAGGDTGKATQAKGIFGKVVVGLIIALAAWLIVQAILTGLGLNSGYSFLSL